MKNKILFLFLALFLVLGLQICVNAEENVKVFNKNKEVELLHEIFCYNEQYYLHVDDFESLGIDVMKEDALYTITTNDCLGEERYLAVKLYTVGEPVIVTPVYNLFSSETNSFTVENVVSLGSGTYKRRSTEKIGYSQTDNSLIIDENVSFSLSAGSMIKVNNELYVSAEFIGDKFSHKYLEKEGNIYFYIADSESVITEITVNLVNGALAPEGGHNVKIHTAYKTGEGTSIDDFEILPSMDCLIPENESSASCIIETPAEKIDDKNIYFIADFGERYVLAAAEYDFSKVGKVLVYAQQKDITYTVDVKLPEIDEKDVSFTIYANVGKTEYSKQGIIKSGEKSTVVELTGLPVDISYKTRIEFDYHKYKNKYLKDFTLLNIAYAKDFKSDFTAEYSKEVVCNVSLPNGYVADKDVVIRLGLSQYAAEGSFLIFDKMTDWAYSTTIILNNENRFEKVCLYTQSSIAMLSYKLIGEYEGLCEKVYLKSDGKLTTDRNLSAQITENMFAYIPLLEKKNITLNVLRPFPMNLENDIFAKIELSYLNGNVVMTKVYDYTESPLIPKGESKAQIEIEIEECNPYYTLKIVNISGDDRLFNYYCYVPTFYSPSETSKMKHITFEDDIINIDLFKCNNITGRVECDNNLTVTVTASCKLFNGNTVDINSKAVNGEFNLKIPEDTDTYILYAQTKAGIKSYYVSDGKSSNSKEDANEIYFMYDDDREVVIKYIVQNPLTPVEIVAIENNECFEYKNISDEPVGKFNVVIAYYDADGKLISVNITEKTVLTSGSKSREYITLNDNYKIKKAKCFVVRNDNFKPLGNISEIDL